MSKRGPCFSEKEKLAILKEGEKNGELADRAVEVVKAAHGLKRPEAILEAEIKQVISHEKRAGR
jgi:hypothetical protein